QGDPLSGPTRVGSARPARALSVPARGRPRQRPTSPSALPFSPRVGPSVHPLNPTVRFVVGGSGLPLTSPGERRAESRPKGGEGVSTPFPIFPFHGLRGKRKIG